MRKFFRPRSVTLLGLALSLLCHGLASATVVRFTTSVGNVDVRLYNTLTPNSVTNFLNYVTANRYTNTFIHRVPQNTTSPFGSSHFVVQGGGFLLNNSIFAATGITTNAPIGDEFHLSNQRGTLAFAKNAQGATSQWFFNIGNNSFLDAQNFTVFGRVLGTGMTVVDSIDNLGTIDAHVAENGPGEDFDEIPVKNVQTVLNQGDITNNDAIMISVAVLNYQAGDYDFNGTVNATDYTIWRNNMGSTTNAAPDGNGDGVVDTGDYVVWRNTLGQTGGPGSGAGELGSTVPEPTAVFLAVSGSLLLLARRRRRVVA
jgi:peptidyl-prolyl cis-trans isomerase A (cyclophilin A)